MQRTGYLIQHKSELVSLTLLCVMCYRQVVDTNGDGRINFKEFTLVFEKICRGDITHKMRMLYEMHLPPALLPEEIAELAARESDSFDVVEAAGIDLQLVLP